MKIPTMLILTAWLLVSCNADSDFLPSKEVDSYLYSGVFKAIQKSYIIVGELEHPNNITDCPIQFVADIDGDNLVFTLYGRRHGIYEVDLFILDVDCLEFNSLEFIDYQIDRQGNDLIKIIFPEDFWKKCYLEKDKEKEVSFLIKSRLPIF